MLVFFSFVLGQPKAEAAVSLRQAACLLPEQLWITLVQRASSTGTLFHILTLQEAQTAIRLKHFVMQFN